MTQYGLFFDQTRCTGCYTCVVACKDWYDIEAGPVNLMRIKKIEKGKYPKPFLAYLVQPCYHCENPPCLKACPSQAISKDSSFGVVVVDRDKCIGKDECGSRCLKACPWDAPQFGPEANARMRKCDLCLERLEQGQKPVCVDGCPMYALDAGPLEKLRAEHGNTTEAEGFTYSERHKPSIVFKPRKSSLK